jgi:hypothetical protein
MSSSNQNPAAPALAAGGALLLLISLFVNWFSLDAGAQGQNVSVGFARPDVATVLLVGVIAVAVYVAAGRFRGTLAGQSGLLVGAGAAALLYVIVNIIKKPQLLDLATTAFDEAKKQAGGSIPGGADLSVGLGIGLWLALLGSLLVLGAGLMEQMAGSSTGGAKARPGGGIGAGGPPSPSPGVGAGPGPAAASGGATTAGNAPAPSDRNPGWQPDPYGQARLRYWDGSSWTEHTN